MNVTRAPIRFFDVVRAWFEKSNYTAIAAIAFALLLGCGGSNTSSSGAGPGNAFVYTTDSKSGVIFGFANDSNGLLRPVSGSPFPGSGGAFDIAATPNGKFLYMTGKNGVNGFSINPTSGALTALPCPAVSVSGTIAITPSSSFLYLTDISLPIFPAFSIDANTGCLTLLGTASTGAPVGATRAVVDRSGRFLYVAQGPDILTFSINSDGTVSGLPIFDLSTIVCCFTSIVPNPTADLLFIVSDNVPELQVLAINPASGALSRTGNFFAGGSKSLNTFAVNSQGTFGYLADSQGLNAFSIGPGGAPTSVPGSPFGTGGSSLGLDPSGRFLYALSANSIGAFSVNSGVPTQQQTISLVAVNAVAMAVVGHP